MEEAVEKDPNVKNREIRIFRLSRETECTPCNTHKRSYRRYIWLNSKGSNGQKTKQKKKNHGIKWQSSRGYANCAGMQQKMEI